MPFVFSPLLLGGLNQQNKSPFNQTHPHDLSSSSVEAQHIYIKDSKHIFFFSRELFPFKSSIACLFLCCLLFSYNKGFQAKANKMSEKQKMWNSSSIELAIQRELGYGNKVPQKEVATKLTRSPSFQDWSNTGLISSDASGQDNYLALHREPSSPNLVQSPLGFPRLQNPSSGPQNPIGLISVKDEPYSGPQIPILAMKELEGPSKLPNEKICTINVSHEAPPLVPFSNENPSLGRRAPPPSPQPDPIHTAARFQTNPFPSVPTKPRSGQKRKETENEQQSTDNKKSSVGSLVCELCQAGCSSARAMQEHLNGRHHKAKLEWYKLQRDRGGPGTHKPMCRVCQIWCTDGDTLELHFKGQKHKSKVQEVEACKRNGGAVVDKKPILCQICNVHCMNEDLFKMHLKGRQHAHKKSLIY